MFPWLQVVPLDPEKGWEYQTINPVAFYNLLYCVPDNRGNNSIYQLVLNSKFSFLVLLSSPII